MSKIAFSPNANGNGVFTISSPNSGTNRAIALPDAAGTIPLLAAASNTAITSTPAELNALDGITAVVGELNALDIGSTAIGTAVASKAVILDSNKDYTGIRNLTITGGVHLGGTGSANFLDDYEEGTFTPTDNSGASLTFTAPTGKYTKVGNAVFFNINLTYPTTNSSNNAALSGFPFTTSNDGDSDYSVGSVRTSRFAVSLLFRNSTNMRLFNADGSSVTNANLTGDGVRISGHYFV